MLRQGGQPSSACSRTWVAVTGGGMGSLMPGIMERVPDKGVSASGILGISSSESAVH